MQQSNVDIYLCIQLMFDSVLTSLVNQRKLNLYKLVLVILEPTTDQLSSTCVSSNDVNYCPDKLLRLVSIESIAEEIHFF